MAGASGSTRAVTVRVPAKINLGLSVGPRRRDGYHELATVFQAVSLYDDVTVQRAADWGATITGPYADKVPAGLDNLAVEAALRVNDWLVEDDRVHLVHAVHVSIAKEIPVAGGMAGGSADAAAALVGTDALYGGDLGSDVLHQIAAGLGSDVNFALHGGTAMGSGRGERLAPVLGRGTYTWVLAMSERGLSTPKVFTELDRLRAARGEDAPDPAPAPELMTALRAGDPRRLAAALSNDLQEAAFSLRPDLKATLEEGLEYGALGGIVSGSGPTVAFLVDGMEAALDLSVALAASGAVTGDIKRATGPVPGAHILPAR